MNYPIELAVTYDIQKKIGEGSGGEVYLAVHKRLQKYVVLKKIKSTVSIKDRRTEVDILKNLRHSYLPQVIDFIEIWSDDGRTLQGIYTVMDFIPGKSLKKMMDEGHEFTEKEVLTYASQLCEALNYLHSQNPPIIHGDIKPDNIMITPEGNVCLIDFNISGMLEGQGIKLMGLSFGYASPEQIKAVEEIKEQRELSVSVDKRSDVFSVGATLYALLAKQPYDLNKKKVRMPDVSEGFSVVLSRALEKKPDKRYSDAGAMLQALANVHKKDKKYRKLLMKQEITIIIFIFLMAASAFLMIEGKHTMERELEQRYDELIEAMEEGIENALTPEEFDEYYTEAIGLHSEDVTPYYTKAYYIFNTEGVESAQNYMNEVFEFRLEGSDDIFCNLYYLYAECRFRAEDYEQAQWYYKKALSYRDDNPTIYRDYAISLVYLDQVEEAEELLAEAIEEGMTQTDIYMVQGEIQRISGHYEEALECFENVINASMDEYIIQRACIMGSKTYASIGTTEALIDDIQWLSDGVKLLSAGNRILIYERMVRNYIALGEATKETHYYDSAVDILKEIISMGWDSYLTYSNIVVLHQRSGKTTEAREWAEIMCEEYPDHYLSYMRMAFTELEMENIKAADDRDYSDFVSYYEEAQELYKKQTSGNETNSEMLLLENAYQQLLDGNWITE